jgi:hypothetical protein
MMKKPKAQSFLEFALVLPILLLILMGVVELTLFIGRYISLVDLTREAARFASNRDPFKSGTKANCNTSKDFNFWFDTSCIFSPLKGDPGCTYLAFCNGFNGSVPIKFDEDDILISVFTESMLPNPTPAYSATKIPTITQDDPRLVALSGSNPWVWSTQANPDPDTTHRNNWLRDCDRRGNNPYDPANPNNLANRLPANPYFTPARLQSYMSQTAYAEKGFVTVEIYYCYHQVLGMPIISNFIPNPILIHTYTVMPLPSLQPTAVPTP